MSTSAKHITEMQALHNIGAKVRKSDISRREQFLSERITDDGLDLVALNHSLSATEAAKAARMARNTFDKRITAAIEEGVITNVEKAKGRWQFSQTHMHLFLDYIGKPDFSSQHPEYRSHVVNIQNQKGGTGKSTTAVNLAASMTLPLDKRMRVLLLDLDPQGSLRQFMQLNDETDEFVTPVELMLAENNSQDSAYMNLRNEGLTHEEILLQYGVIPTHLTNFFIMPAMPSDECFTAMAWEQKIQTGEMPLLTSLKSNVIDHLKEYFDVILIDTGPHNNPLTWAAAYASDGLLIPCAARQLDWHSTSQYMENLPPILERNLPTDWNGFKWWRVLCTNYDDSDHKKDVQVLNAMKDELGSRLFNDMVKKSELFEEAASRNLTIWDITKSQTTVSRLQWEKAIESMKNVRQTLLMTMTENWPHKE